MNKTNFLLAAAALFAVGSVPANAVITSFSFNGKGRVDQSVNNKPAFFNIPPAKSTVTISGAITLTNPVPDDFTGEIDLSDGTGNGYFSYNICTIVKVQPCYGSGSNDFFGSYGSVSITAGKISSFGFITFDDPVVSIFNSGSFQFIYEGYATNWGGSYRLYQPVPEPATWVLLITGFAISGFFLRGRRATSYQKLRIARLLVPRNGRRVLAHGRYPLLMGRYR
jgi:hypothetical protein